MLVSFFVVQCIVEAGKRQTLERGFYETFREIS